MLQDLINLVQLDNILIGDFNAEPEEENMLDVLNIYNLKNLLRQKTCYKNLDNLSFIDLILTSCHRGFRNANVFKTGLSYFYKMIVSVLKSHFPKQKPNIFTLAATKDSVLVFDTYDWKITEISRYQWSWQCPSYRALQGFWLYESKYIWRRYQFIILFGILHLENKELKTENNGSYSNFDGISSGVSQDSISGPYLTYTFVIYFFGFGNLDITSYADNNAPYTFSSELDVALKKLRSYIIKNIRVVSITMT